MAATFQRSQPAIHRRCAVRHARAGWVERSLRSKQRVDLVIDGRHRHEVAEPVDALAHDDLREDPVVLRYRRGVELHARIVEPVAHEVVAPRLRDRPVDRRRVSAVAAHKVVRRVGVPIKIHRRRQVDRRRLDLLVEHGRIGVGQLRIEGRRRRSGRKPEGARRLEHLPIHRLQPVRQPNLVGRAGLEEWRGLCARKHQRIGRCIVEQLPLQNGACVVRHPHRRWREPDLVHRLVEVDQHLRVERHAHCAVGRRGHVVEREGRAAAAPILRRVGCA